MTCPTSMHLDELRKTRADLAGRLNANGDNERGWALLERIDRELGLGLSTKATSNERGSALP